MSDDRSSPLRGREFRLLFAGQTVSMIGDGIVPVAVAFAILDRLGGTRELGWVLTSGSIPLVAFLLVGGVVADRVPRRALMLVADVARMLCQGALGILLVSGQARLWQFLVLTPVWGAASAFFNPASSALWPQTVSADQLQAANGLRQVSAAAASLLGPAVAGIVVAGVGPGWALVADGATFAASAACLAAMRLPSDVAAASRASFLSDLREGWDEFASRSWLWSVVVQFGVWHVLCYSPVIVLGAVIAHDRLGGATAWGLVLAAFGAGSVVGGGAMLRRTVRRPIVLATIATMPFALVLAALASGAPLGVVIVAAAVAGVGIAVFSTLWETTIVREVPPTALARVSAYDWFGSVALSPVGFAIVGPLTGVFGAATVLWVGAAYSVLSALAVLAVPGVRGLVATAPLPNPA